MRRRITILALAAVLALAIHAPARASALNIAPLANGGTLTVESLIGTISNLVDGNLTTGLWVNSAGNGLARRDFGVARAINRVRLEYQDTAGGNIYFYFYAPGGDATADARVVVGTLLSGDHYQAEWTGPSESWQNVRVRGTSIDRYSYIWEFEIYEAEAGLFVQGVSMTDGVHLSWNTATAPYTVKRGGTTLDDDIAGTTYLDAAAPWGSSCTYAVSDSGALTGNVVVATLPAPPVVDVTGATTNTISIAWAAVATATSYDIYRNGIYQGNQTGLTFADGNLAPDTLFTYAVAALNAVGTGLQSDPVQETTDAQPPPPAAPTGLHLDARGVTFLSVGWSPVAGVGGYKVYLDGGLYGLSATTTATISGLNAGTSYSVKVQAYAGIYDGEISSALAASTVGVPGLVTALAADPGPITLTLTWGPPTAGDPATSYNVYLFGELEGNTASLAWTVLDLAPDMEYEMAVAGVNDAGEGPWATIISHTTDMEPPGLVTGLAGTATVRTITATWNALAGASGYRAYLAGVLAGETAGTSWTFAALLPNTEYLIAVRAVNEAGPGEEVSIPVTTMEGPPVILRLGALGSGYVVTYTGPGGQDAPDRYEVWADEELRTTATVPSQFPDPDLDWTTGTSHEIVVKAYYGVMSVQDSATVTAYVAVDPLEYPPPAGLMEGILQDWSGVLIIVTSLSVVWMVWDWWLRLMRHDPFDVGEP